MTGMGVAFSEWLINRPYGKDDMPPREFLRLKDSFFAGVDWRESQGFDEYGWVRAPDLVARLETLERLAAKVRSVELGRISDPNVRRIPIIPISTAEQESQRLLRETPLPPPGDDI